MLVYAFPIQTSLLLITCPDFKIIASLITELWFVYGFCTIISKIGPLVTIISRVPLTSPKSPIVSTQHEQEKNLCCSETLKWAYYWMNQRSNCQQSLDHWKSKRVPGKHLFLLYWLCQSLWLCGSQQTVENSERDGNTRPPDLPPEKSVCRSGSNI